MKSKAYVFANAADYDINDLSEQVTLSTVKGTAARNVLMSG